MLASTMVVDGGKTCIIVGTRLAGERTGEGNLSEVGIVGS